MAYYPRMKGLKRRVCLLRRQRGAVTVNVFEFRTGWAHQPIRRAHKEFWSIHGRRPGALAREYIEEQNCEVMTGERFDRLQEQSLEARMKASGFGGKRRKRRKRR